MQFSEQQIIDCQHWYYDCYGCNGGWPFMVFELSVRYPILREDSYRAYNGMENTCTIDLGSNIDAAGVVAIDTSASSHLASA